VNGRRGHGTTIGALLFISFAAVLLLADGNTGGAGPAPNGGVRPIRGEIVPLEQTRTLHVTAYAFVGEPPACDIEKHDAAEDFGDYDNTLIADCDYGWGKAGQQSSIAATFLSADGLASAHGVGGGGVYADGSGESVFEVVFDSSTTQWCTLSGEISTSWSEDSGGGHSEVVLTDPDGVVLFEVRLAEENDLIAFDEEILLAEGGPYILRASSYAMTDGGMHNEYSVLLELAGEVPANDVGVLAVNHPPTDVPAGACTVDLTIANYGSEDQEVPVHCEVMGPGALFLDEGFDGSFPPPGWYQEQDGEWQLHEGNDAGGAAPEAWLDRDNIIDDYAFLDSAPMDTTNAARIVLECKLYVRIYNPQAVARILTRASAVDDWTDVTPWPNPLPDSVHPQCVRIDISHDIGPATQVRFEYDSDDWRLQEWYLNDVRIYDVSEVYASEILVTVPALSQVEAEFDPAWEATEGLYVLEVATDLPGDEHPDNDGRSMMLTVGPVTQYEKQKLTGSGGETHDDFAIAIAVHGDWAIIGASSKEVNNDDYGAAYAFRFDGSTWTEQQMLLASDAAEYDWFGCSVAMNDDIALIGAYNDANENGDDAGAAYVFRFDGSAWYEEAKLIASDGAEDDYFGYAVCLDGDLAIVGADEDDDNGEDSGSAYIYRYDGSTWIEERKLLASDGSPDDYFGSRVALDGDVAVVGAAGDDDLGECAGAVYVFRYQRGDWIEEAKLLASDGAEEDFFGSAVAIGGDRLVVGAFRDDDLGRDCGAVYVFQYEGSAWTETAKLLPSDAGVRDEFGSSVALEDDRIVVGARAYWLGEGGAAYLFTYRNGTWEQTTRMLSSDLVDDDELGGAVAIHDGRIFVGAPGDENDTGAAYVFTAPIAGDIDGDGDVDTADLLALLAAWGPCEACPEDINGDGTVNTEDLLILLGNWG